MTGCVGGIRGVLGAGRDCRYSGARRGIGASGGIEGSWGCRACRGTILGASQGVEGIRSVSGADRDSRYSGARRGMKGIRGVRGVLEGGRDSRYTGARGYRGIRALGSS